MKVRRRRIEPDDPGVVGLDLSLTGTAVCWAPRSWDGDLRLIRTLMLGYPLTKDATPADQSMRFETIARGIVEFAQVHPTIAFYVEDHAFGMGGSSAARLRELHGAVRLAVIRAFGLGVHPVNISSGRKTLLQKLPASGAKEFTATNVRSIGPIAARWNADEVDAFVVMNHGIMLEGGIALSFMGQPTRRPR